MNKPVIVAIDGPGGSGKSTAAKKVAARLGFVHINTGAMYRSVALWALRLQVALDDHLKLTQLAENAEIQFAPGTRAVLLNGEDVTAQLYGKEMDAAASRVSLVSGVRTALVAKMRAMAATENVVMEGRDIGTVVFPDAGVKVFLDASPEVRAQRRAAEAGLAVGQVAASLQERDERDKTRAEAPLLQAPDATYLDSSSLTEDEVVEAILHLIRQRTANGKGHS